MGSSIAGTTMMTLYSYAISWTKNKNFKEPLLLAQMVYRLMPWLQKKDSRIAGWGVHYLTGLLFAESYAAFWSQDTFANIKTGLVLGGISGIAAILIWKFTLEAHPFPPPVHFFKFAGQLFIAHIVFGLASALGYTFLNKIRQNGSR